MKQIHFTLHFLVFGFTFQLVGGIMKLAEKEENKGERETKRIKDRENINGQNRLNS